MAPTLASVADLAAHTQQDFDEPDAYSADLALQIATDLICGYLRRVPADLTPAPAAVRGICLDVAARRLTNPLGRATETTPGYAYTNSSAAVGLTPDERAALDNTGLSRRAAGAYTISLAPLDAS